MVIQKLKQQQLELVTLRWAFTSPDGDGYVGDGEFEDTFNPTMNAQAGVFEQLPQG